MITPTPDKIKYEKHQKIAGMYIFGGSAGSVLAAGITTILLSRAHQPELALTVPVIESLLIAIYIGHAATKHFSLANQYRKQGRKWPELKP